MGQEGRSLGVKSAFSIFRGISAGNGRPFFSQERVFRPVTGSFRRTGDGQGDRGRKAGDDDRPLRPLRAFVAGDGGGGGAVSGVGRMKFFWPFSTGCAGPAGTPDTMPAGGRKSAVYRHKFLSLPPATNQRAARRPPSPKPRQPASPPPMATSPSSPPDSTACIRSSPQGWTTSGKTWSRPSPPCSTNGSGPAAESKGGTRG
jgi:hypothetical protein